MTNDGLSKSPSVSQHRNHCRNELTDVRFYNRLLDLHTLKYIFLFSSIKFPLKYLILENAAAYRSQLSLGYIIRDVKFVLCKPAAGVECGGTD